MAVVNILNARYEKYMKVSGITMAIQLLQHKLSGFKAKARGHVNRVTNEEHNILSCFKGFIESLTGVICSAYNYPYKTQRCNYNIKLLYHIDINKHQFI